LRADLTCAQPRGARAGDAALKFERCAERVESVCDAGRRLMSLAVCQRFTRNTFGSNAIAHCEQAPRADDVELDALPCIRISFDPIRRRLPDHARCES